MLTDTKIASIKPPASGQEEHPDHKVTGLRLRVGAGGKKTWTLRKRVGAKTINRKLGTYPAMKLAQARNAAEAMIGALERDGSTEGIDRTFKHVAEHWLENKAKKKNKRWQDQERQLELHVYPAWGDQKVSAISRTDVRALLEGLEGKVLPNRILALVRTIFRWAASQDWIESSPAYAIEAPNPESARDRWLKPDEFGKVWNSAKLLGYPNGPFVQLLMLTGQRRGEVSDMRWKDVNLDAREWIIPDTKSNRPQLVPLSPAAVSILEKLPVMGEYVFTLTGASPISGFAKAKSRLDRYLKSKGDDIGNWRFHDLRRTAATHMVRLGIPELVVSRVLNHAVQGVRDKHYNLYSYADEKRAALEAWAAEVEQAASA